MRILSRMHKPNSHRYDRGGAATVKERPAPEPNPVDEGYVPDVGSPYEAGGTVTRGVYVTYGGFTVCRLTPREAEVADMLAEGASNKEVADACDISVKTVDTHRQHVLHKTGVRNNAGLARLWVAIGRAGATVAGVYAVPHEVKS